MDLFFCAHSLIKRANVADSVVVCAVYGIPAQNLPVPDTCATHLVFLFIVKLSKDYDGVYPHRLDNSRGALSKYIQGPHVHVSLNARRKKKELYPV